MPHASRSQVLKIGHFGLSEDKPALHDDTLEKVTQSVNEKTRVLENSADANEVACARDARAGDLLARDGRLVVRRTG